MFIEPFTAILGAANIGASLLGGSQAASAQNSATRAQTSAAKFAAKKQLEAANTGVAGNLTGMQFNEAVVAPNELARQKSALAFEYGPMAALQRAGRSEDFRRAMEQQTSGPYKEAMQFANREQMKNALAERMGQMQGMFGPIAPISVDRMFA